MTPPAYESNSKLFGFQMWPISNLIGMMYLPKATPETARYIKPKFKVKTHHENLTEIINGIPLRMLPFVIVAIVCHYFYPIQVQMEESKVAILKFMDGDRDIGNHQWLLKLAVRDLISQLILPPIWLMILNQPHMRLVKLNKDYTLPKHMKREIAYSISTVLMSTLWEAICMVMYATGYANKYFLDWREKQLVFVAWILINPIWRDGHFYVVHRAMHNWNTTYIPDIGKWLYDVAHSVHHQSRNFQPWSGISMHPIEGFLYESAVIVPMFFVHHPLLLIIMKIDLSWAAILSHDGYEFPGNGDWFHLVHHMKINCNFGTPNAPFDLLFGTVDYGEDMDSLKIDKIEKYAKELEEEQAKGKKKQN